MFRTWCVRWWMRRLDSKPSTPSTVRVAACRVLRAATDLLDDLYISTLDWPVFLALLFQLLFYLIKWPIERLADLIARLDDWRIFKMQRTACIALGAIGDTRAVEMLIHLLEDGSYFQVWQAACKALGAIGDTRAVKPLARFIESLSLSLSRRFRIFPGKTWAEASLMPRRVHRVAWSRWVFPSSVPSDWRLSQAQVVCEALGAIGDTRAVEPLIDLLGVEDWRVRRAACKALTKLGEGRLARAVIGTLAGQEEARQELVALHADGDIRAVEPLIAGLGDEDSQVRQAVCEALGAIGDTRAVAPLIEGLGDGNSQVRWAACNALVAIGTAAVEALIVWVRVGRPWQMMDKWRPRLASSWEEEQLEWFSVYDRRASAFSAYGLESADKRIAGLKEEWIAGLKEERLSWVQQAACMALGAIGDTRAVEPLIVRLGDEDSQVQQAACVALGALGLVSVRPLVQQLEHLKNVAPDTFRLACEEVVALTQPLKPQLDCLLCRTCLGRFERRRLSSGFSLQRYICCRVCQAADTAIFAVREVVAVLDSSSQGPEFMQMNDVVYVHWLQRDALFDFDRVEIAQASEYDVERFCAQVGNDTDALRRSKYGKMLCTIDPRCGLSQGTLNMLKHSFDKVEVRAISDR